MLNIINKKDHWRSLKKKKKKNQPNKNSQFFKGKISNLFCVKGQIVITLGFVLHSLCQLYNCVVGENIVKDNM